MKTVHGLLHQVVDYLTAAIGWIDMSDPVKAVKEMKLAIGVITEIEQRLTVLLRELEHEVELKIQSEVHITPELKPEIVVTVEPTVKSDVVSVKVKPPDPPDPHDPHDPTA